MTRDRFNVIAWVLLLSIVAWSVFQTAKTNSQLADAQEAMQRSSNCTQQFLGATVLALNERTTYSTQQAEANVALQEAQVEFLSLLSTDRGNDPATFNEALGKYLEAQRTYSEVVALNAGQVRQYPYPTVEEYRTCLSGDAEPSSIKPPNPPIPSD